MTDLTNTEMDTLKQIVPAARPARDATHFRSIIAARKAVEEAEARLRQAVTDARDAGDSWTVIGAAHDTTRQAAYQRFGKGGPSAKPGKANR
jgi:hypothetical protein